MKKGSRTVFNTVMTLVCLVFLICGATWLILGLTPIYSLQCSLFHIPETSGYDLETCIRNYKVLIQYNMFWGAHVLNFPDFTMSASGAYHFMEVKGIFVAMQYGAIISGLLLIPGIRISRMEKIYGWQRAAVLAAIAIVGVVGLAIAIDWNGTFVLFHKLLFNNDFWLFDGATDPVIYILPDEVFMTDALGIILIIAIGLCILEGRYRHHRGPVRKSRKKH